MNHLKTSSERKIGKNKLKAKVLIACEDTKSAKIYLQKLAKDCGVLADVIFAKHIGTDPMSVYTAIAEHIRLNSKIKYESKWIVIDRDSWSLGAFNGAISSAKSQGIHVAYSNEAYELLLLLHYRRQTASITRNKLKSELSKKGYLPDYEKGDELIYEKTIKYQDDAIKNAQELLRRHINNNGIISPDSNNPSTTFHCLVCYLKNISNKNSLPKVAAECKQCYSPAVDVNQCSLIKK